MFVFDLQESTWSELNTSGSVPYGRSDMGTAALGDKIYVFGGWSNSKGSLLPCTSPPDHDAQSDHDALRRGVLAPRASPCLALMTFAILSLARERALRLVACARTLTRASEAEAAHPPWDLTCLALACRGCCSVSSPLRLTPLTQPRSHRRSSDQTWTELSGSVSGVAPWPRYKLGMAAAGGKVYVFGGQSKLGQPERAVR
eukprot:3922835-Rhodomonas_salina.1